MARELIEVNQEQHEQEFHETIKDIPSMTLEDGWQLMAHYPDSDSGGRVFFNPRTEQIVFESRTKDKMVRVSLPLKTFMQKIESVTLQDLWQKQGFFR